MLPVVRPSATISRPCRFNAPNASLAIAQSSKSERAPVHALILAAIDEMGPARYHRRLVFARYSASRRQQRSNTPPGAHSRPFPAHSLLKHMTDCPQKERCLSNLQSNLFAPPCSPKRVKLRQSAMACSRLPKWGLTPRSQTL